MIHFFDPSNERIAAKLPDLARTTDIVLCDPISVSLG
jgi:hypothetical protein